MKNTFLILVLCGLLLVSADEPMFLVFVIGIGCELFRRKYLLNDEYDVWQYTPSDFEESIS